MPTIRCPPWSYTCIVKDFRPINSTRSTHRAYSHTFSAEVMDAFNSRFLQGIHLEIGREDRKDGPWILVLLPFRPTLSNPAFPCWHTIRHSKIHFLDIDQLQVMDRTS